MRFRLGSFLDTDANFRSLDAHIETEMGIGAGYSTVGNWKQHLAKWDLVDVLNLVTHVHRYLQQVQQYGRIAGTTTPARWILEVNRIFDERNLQYVVDEHGSVRYRIDEEHARNITATIQRLQPSRYANVLHLFENGRSDLTKAPPDGKAAIREVFLAAESLAKLLLPNMPRLGGKEVEPLRAKVASKYHGDPVAVRSADSIFDGFKDWVSACQQYRHEQGKPDQITQPTLEIAVHLVNVGASYLRWLVDLDSQ